MANQISKTMATLAVGGLVVGLAACGGSTPAPDTQATPGAGTEAHSCKGGEEHKCAANGKCGANKEAAPADGTAAPADGTAAPAPK